MNDLSSEQAPPPSDSAPINHHEKLSKVKNEVINHRNVSQSNDPLGRLETARAIRKARISRDAVSKAEQRLHQITQEADTSQLKSKEIQDAIANRNNALVVKIKNLIGFGDKQLISFREEIDSLKSEQDALRAQKQAEETDLILLRQAQAEEPDPKQLLKTYYERVLTTPISNEQKRELLKPEVLENLTTDEYIALWRRLNPYFLSHVTRQGFRDHNAMQWHNKGLNEFHDGFTSMLFDGKLLRPPIAVRGLKTRGEAGVKEFLTNQSIFDAETAEQAKKDLYALLTKSLAATPSYPDKTAVHFAGQWVADRVYGSERGNEIFFIFPADIIGSQYNFSFSWDGGTFERPTDQGEWQWNDISVWPISLDNSGISLDSGLVFLPKNTQVDSETGSKYAHEVQIIDGQEKKVMVRDEKASLVFKQWIVNKLSESLTYKAFTRYRDERNYNLKIDLREFYFRSSVEEISSMGFDKETAYELSDRLLTEFHWREELLTKGSLDGKPLPEFREEFIRKIFEESGAIWKRSSNTIPSQQYWENYFSEHGDIRPKHIIYYQSSPTTSVFELLQNNNIGQANTLQKYDGLLGFDDHNIVLNRGTGVGQMDMNQDPRVLGGFEDLLETANNLIDHQYKYRQVSA